MKKIQRYQELASKWLNNTISEEEKKEFAAWYNDGQDKHVFIESEFADSEDEYRKYLLEKIIRLIELSDKKNRQTYTNKKRWFYFAAAIFCMAVLGVFLRPNRESALVHETVDNSNMERNDYATTNRYGATITLAEGKIIHLDSLPIGKIIKEEGVAMKKISASAVIYMPSKEIISKSNPIVYHTLRTPFGKDYHLILSDGSKIWLNATSELSFSALPENRERRVKLNGEAYFAINHLAHDKAVPFIVESRLQEVYVMGTEFNINAYGDEEWISTTLVNGSVKIKQFQNDVMAVLKPHQQAVVGPTTSKIKVKKVDVSEIISWKEGYFNFNDSDIKAVLRQFARWYDVEVIYERNHFTDAYMGKIPKSLSLVEALSVLETVGVKFKVEGKKLIII